MAEVIRGSYKDIADAIRAKKGTSKEMTPAEMPGEISSILKPTGKKTITENGENIDVAQYEKVDVEVPSGPSLEDTSLYFYDEDTQHFTELTDYFSDDAPINLDDEMMGTAQFTYNYDTYVLTKGDFSEGYLYTYWGRGGFQDSSSSMGYDGSEKGAQLGYMWDAGSGMPFGLECFKDDNNNSIFLENMEVGESKTFTFDQYGYNKRFTITRIESEE